MTFLIKAEKNNIPISVISSGMKARIERKVFRKKANNITVITNGTEKSDENDTKFILRRRHFNARKVSRIL
ncbi:MAG: hypothetical protein ACLU3F_09950 [Blautia wexlerae]